LALLCIVISSHPVVAQPTKTVHLSDLDLSLIDQGWGTPGKDRAVTDTPLSIAGNSFKHGVGTHSVGFITIDLHRDAKRFHSYVGIDDAADPSGSVRFIVKGDGRVLFDSGIMKAGDSPREINIDVENISKLTLKTTDGGDKTWNDHANWADSSIEYKGQRPEIVPHRSDLLYEICGWEGESRSKLASPVDFPFVEALRGDIKDYMIVTFTSSWGNEYRFETQRLDQDGYTYRETDGQSAGGQKPFIIVYNTKTQKGISIFNAWSGNWEVKIAQEKDKPVRLSVSTIPACLPDVTKVSGLPIPGALVSYFTGHWDYGTLPIRRFIRKRLLREHRDNWPVVQFNQYFDGKGRFTAESVMNKARIAAQSGCELFVIDAGWYGNDKRWRRSIGDWWVNDDKFPDGLKPVAETIRDRGMQFGLWVSMECVSVGSKMIQEHPNWVLIDKRIVERPISADPSEWTVAGRTNYQSRVGPIVNLDFGKQKVISHQKRVIDQLMERYALDYLKMDYNVTSRTGSWYYSGPSDPLYSHLEGVIDFWSYIREAYPSVTIENCSSGSKRADVMTSAFTDTHWTSDEVGNVENLMANYGATYLFPPEMCSAWTTYPENDSHDKVLNKKARFTVNMMGHFGLSGEIDEWSQDTLKLAKERILAYKDMRSLIRSADVYHLTPQINVEHPSSTVAMQYAHTDKDVSRVFVFQGNDPQLTKKLRLRAMRPNQDYRIDFPDSLGGETIVRGGKYLLETGLKVSFEEKGMSGIIGIESVDRPRDPVVPE
jgi:alpha-galactosidase